MSGFASWRLALSNEEGHRQGARDLDKEDGMSRVGIEYLLLPVWLWRTCGTGNPGLNEVTIY